VQLRRLPILASLLLATPALSEPIDGAFDAAVHPAAPDYARPRDWTVWRGGDAGAPVDLFFIQPTTFVSQRWNQDPGDVATNRLTQLGVVERQLNAFDTCCRIYAPRYRQASTRAFTEMAGDGAKAYALAYQDVRHAFRWYMAHENRGRPFLIVAHSQGTLHAMRLLEQEIDGKPAARHLVAVYAPGLGIPIGTFGTALKIVSPCDTPTRTRCLASWNSFTPDADTAAFVKRSTAAYVGQHGEGPGAELLCINPLTFASGRPQATAKDDLGALLTPPGDTAGPSLTPSAAGATCRDGVLRVDATVALHPLPGGSLHFYDIPLFWANIRDNASRRIRAYLDAR
jgi:hypothetical protein